MYENLWWVWVVAGLLLVGLEVFTPGFIVMWFGIAAMISAVPVYLGASTKVIVVTYTVSLLLLTVFGRRITLNLFTKYRVDIKTNTDSLIGRAGVVTTGMHPAQPVGRVRVNNESWSAVSDGGDAIAEGENVVVQGVEGVKLNVKKGGMT